MAAAKAVEANAVATTDRAQQRSFSVKAIAPQSLKEYRGALEAMAEEDAKALFGKIVRFRNFPSADSAAAVAERATALGPVSSLRSAGGRSQGVRDGFAIAFEATASAVEAVAMFDGCRIGGCRIEARIAFGLSEGGKRFGRGRFEDINGFSGFEGFQNLRDLEDLEDLEDEERTLKNSAICYNYARNQLALQKSSGRFLESLERSEGDFYVLPTSDLHLKISQQQMVGMKLLAKQLRWRAYYLDPEKYFEAIQADGDLKDILLNK